MTAKNFCSIIKFHQFVWSLTEWDTLSWIEISLTENGWVKKLGHPEGFRNWTVTQNVCTFTSCVAYIIHIPGHIYHITLKIYISRRFINEMFHHISFSKIQNLSKQCRNSLRDGFCRDAEKISFNLPSHRNRAAVTTHNTRSILAQLSKV